MVQHLRRFLADRSPPTLWGIRTGHKLSESATAPRLCLFVRLLLSPRSRLRFAYRQHGVIEVATAPRLCVGCIEYAHRQRKDNVGQVVVIRVLCGRFFGG